VLDCAFYEIRRQLQYKATMRGARIMVADRFFPSTQTCSECGCLSGPKGHEQLNVEQWICSECGAEHDRDINAAINLEKLGRATAESTRGDMTPLLPDARLAASIVDEPRTRNVSRYAHI
jgi:putative transposase